jgi:WD40 repeat protein
MDLDKEKEKQVIPLPNSGIAAMDFTTECKQLVVLYLSFPEEIPPKKSFVPSLRAVGLDAATGTEQWQTDYAPKAIMKGKGLRTLRQMALSPDGKRTVSLDDLLGSPGSGGNIRAVVGDAQSGEELGSFQPDVAGDCRMVFSPDGKRLALWSKGTRTTVGQIWDVEARKLLQTLKGHTAAVMALAFNADGTRLYSADARGTLKEWEVVPVIRKGDGQGQRSVIVRKSKDGSIRAEYSSPRQVGPGLGKQGGPGKVKAEGPIDIRIVSAEGKELRKFSEHQAEVVHVKISADGQVVISVDRAGGVKIRETAGDRVLLEYTVKGKSVWAPPSDQSAFAPQFSPEGKRVAAALPEGGVKVWDLPKFSEIFSKPDKAYMVRGSPDGKRLLAYVDSGDAAIELKLWDVDAKKLLHAGGSGSVFPGFRFSPDGKRLAVILCKIKKIKVLDTTSGTELGEFEGEKAVNHYPAFSPDNQRLAVNNGREVLVWDIASPKKEVFRLKGHRLDASHLAFSPDGKRLASMAGGMGNQTNGELLLWDMVTGSEVMRARQGLGQIIGTELSFSPDGHRLVIRNEANNSSLRPLIFDATPLPEPSRK